MMYRRGPGCEHGRGAFSRASLHYTPENAPAQGVRSSSLRIRPTGVPQKQMERGFPPAPSSNRPAFLPLEHDPGLRGLGALLDAHEIDPRRRGAAAVILAVPTNFVRARGRKLFPKRPNQLPVDRIDPDLDGTAVAERVLDVGLEPERIARDGRRDVGRAGLGEIDRATERHS